MLTGSGDTTARLWDLTSEDPAKTARVLAGHEGSVYAVAISPDNHWLVTGSRDNHWLETGSGDRTARLWVLQLDELLADARRVAGRNFTQREWEQLFPGEPYRNTFEELPAGNSTR